MSTLTQKQYLAARHEVPTEALRIACMWFAGIYTYGDVLGLLAAEGIATDQVEEFLARAKGHIERTMEGK